MNNQSPHITILGAGESGLGAALLAQRQGATVFVSDFGTIGPAQLRELEAAGIAYEMGGHDENRILASDLVIKSPGIPDKAPLIKQLKASPNGPELIGEIEYAYRCMEQGRIVAITGSNGKTTTTMLIAQLLQHAGLDARAGGNLGTSFARLLLEPATADTIYVLELSSFQLDSIKDFRAEQALLLNITPDHLDRYEYQLDNYIDSKLRIFKNQGASDLAYYYGEDENIARGLKRSPTKSQMQMIREGLIPQSRPQDVARGLNPSRNDLTSGSAKKEISQSGASYNLAATPLKGRHNALNARFAIAVATDLGLSPATIQAGLERFEPAAHRMEVIALINGVTYINDSKATNVDATRYALDAVETPLIWIAGGTDKGNDYDPLLPVARGRVRALVCLGVDNAKLNAAFANDIPEIIETDSAELAVQTAAKLAKAGDTVLLSPACASFDLFRNYIDRGDQFRAAVLQLNTHNS
ncbi:MAG: UDP-N-acetylmuramoyl-L-alanine--D-glutamate ligase [Bacteroidota bacterium]